MHYFAYGSNMSVKRLQHRVSSAHPIGVATLSDHRLAFHKIGRDGSAKCDAAQAPGHTVYGVVFTLAEEHKTLLDRYEDLGRGYEDKLVDVTLTNGAVVKAFTYYATRIDASLKPFDWYRRHVIHGATEHALPADYIRALQAIETIDDTDTARRQTELLIYTTTEDE